MAAVLLSAGEKGKRFALPNSRILIHQVLGGAEGQASDIKIQAEEIKRIVDIQLELLKRRLADRKLTIELTERAKEVLAREGYDPVYGARP